MKAQFALNTGIRVYSILLALALAHIAIGSTVYASDTSEKSTSCLVAAQSEDDIKNCLSKDFTDIKEALAKSIIDPKERLSPADHTEASATVGDLGSYR